MRFWLSVLVIALLSAAAEYFLPWWTMAVVCFIASLFVPQKKVKAFIMGFFGIALFWLITALWHDIPNEHILSSRMALLFHLPGYWLFTTATVLIGGSIGGLSALAGAMVSSRR